MRLKLLFISDLLRTSFWFIPSIMAVLAFGLALGLVELDRLLLGHKIDLAWNYSGSADGARQMLATIASSMITVAGVVFSITIVALTLASSQFGPRLMRNFIRDRANQIVLGVFIATFIYCLLVLGAVRSDAYGDFVPSLSIVVGVAFSLVSLAVLIFFIHHVASEIQATHVVAAVSAELREAIDRLFPEDLGNEPASAAEPLRDMPAHFAAASRPLLADKGGYLVAIDNDRLLELAKQHSLIVRLDCRPGQFVIVGNDLAAVLPGEKLDDKLQSQLRGVFQWGIERTLLQDVGFGIDQLVEVAVRALSPGINDPFTACNCIDRLAEAICRILGRRQPSSFRYDDQRQLRVVAHAIGSDALLDNAFQQIRIYGAANPAVLVRLLESLRAMARNARRQPDLAAIDRQAVLVARAADRSLPDDCKPTITAHYEAVLQATQTQRRAIDRDPAEAQ